MKLRDAPEVPGMPGWYAYYIRGSILSKTDPKAGAAAWRIKGGEFDERRFGVMGRNS